MVGAVARVKVLLGLATDNLALNLPNLLPDGFQAGAWSV